MKKYIILTTGITGMGGGQMYVQNKVIYMQKNGWSVQVFSWLDGEILLPKLKKYKNNINFDLTLSPSVYSKKNRDLYIEKIIRLANIHQDDQVIVESGTPVMSYWGELLAEHTRGKHILLLLDERNDELVSREYLPFFYFKLQRRELAGIKVEAIDKLFRGYKGYKADTSVKFSALCQNVVEDYESELEKKVENDRFNICVIGRLEKPFILPAAEGIKKVINRHKEDNYTVFFIGASPKGDIERKLKGLFEECCNCKLVLIGYLFPIPRGFLHKMSYCVSSSGSAGVAYREGIPTISIDGNDLKAIGVLGYTTKNSLFRTSETPIEIDDILEKVIYHDELSKYAYSPSEYQPDIKTLDKHIQFIKNSEQILNYYDTSNISSTKDKIKKIIISAIGIKTYFLCTRRKSLK